MSFDVKSISRKIVVRKYNEVLFGFQVFERDGELNVKITALRYISGHAPESMYRRLIENESKCEGAHASETVKYLELLANYNDREKLFDRPFIKQIYQKLNEKLLKDYNWGLMPTHQGSIVIGLEKLLPSSNS